jgi:hypothetical protein
MAFKTPWLAALSLSWLLACGGKSFEVDPNQGGSDAGGSSQGGSNSKAGSAHGGSTNPGGAPPGGTGQGGGAGSSCESFDDQPPSYVAVEIYNKTMTPIHLGQDEVNCGVAPLFIVDQNGKALGAGGDCRGTCQDLRTTGPVGCPAFCAYPSVLTLQPGEVFYTNWDARFTAEVTLPEQCLPSDGYGNSCVQARAINPGSYTFSSHAGLGFDCSVPGSDATCSPCQPTGNGGCMTPGALILGERIAASTTVVLDSSYGIYGSLPPPAPAFPGESSGAAPQDPIAYQAVQIIFE